MSGMEKKLFDRNIDQLLGQQGQTTRQQEKQTDGQDNDVVSVGNRLVFHEVERNDDIKGSEKGVV